MVMLTSKDNLLCFNYRRHFFIEAT
uniref:Uncharacterized protein n=1 Tax=Lepeophtheirus salmonis TaxID=72036 RepID=A0A0K2UKN7_LEPSM